MGDKTINVSNITISENTVIISLVRYTGLLESEKKVKENTVYTKIHGGWSTSSEDVFTNDEAVKELSLDLVKSREETKKSEQEISKLLTNNDRLLKSNRYYSWKEISTVFIDKIFRRIKKSI